MEDIQLALTAARVDQKNFGVWMRSWQVGHTLQALVVDKSPSGSLLLRIGAQQITATADIPIQKGATLKLEVTQVQPFPMLKVVAQNAQLTIQTETSNRWISSEGTLPIELKQLMMLLSSQVGTAKNTAVLQPLVHSFLRAIFRFEQMGSAGTLKEAIRASGHFYEESVLQNQTFNPRDLKGLLLALLRQLPQESTRMDAEEVPLDTLRRALEDVVMKISNNQLASHRAQEFGFQEWRIDLPLWAQKDLVLLNLRIRREADHKADNEAVSAGWQVSFRAEFPEIGEILSHVYLRGNRVSVVMHAGNQSIARFMDRHLCNLTQALQSHGFEVPVLRCNHEEDIEKIWMSDSSLRLDQSV